LADKDVFRLMIFSFSRISLANALDQ
jgi:hypothetical protein